MKYNDIEVKLKELSVFLNGKEKVEINHVVNMHDVPFIGDRTDENLHGIPYPPSSDLSTKSGIYLFCKEDGEVLYIGKATENNIRNRIFDHLKTPEASDIQGWVTYPKNQFNDNLVKEGKVKVGIYEVKPAKYSSLVEVYLQTIVEELPEFCKRIG